VKVEGGREQLAILELKPPLDSQSTYPSAGLNIGKKSRVHFPNILHESPHLDALVGTSVSRLSAIAGISVKLSLFFHYSDLPSRL
jgi:hypothetical protein